MWLYIVGLLLLISVGCAAIVFASSIRSKFPLGVCYSILQVIAVTPFLLSFLPGQYATTLVVADAILVLNVMLFIAIAINPRTISILLLALIALIAYCVHVFLFHNLP